MMMMMMSRFVERVLNSPRRAVNQPNATIGLCNWASSAWNLSASQEQ